MGVIFGEPGKVIYVKPRDDRFFKGIARPRFIKANEHLRYFANKPACIEILDEPTNIKITKNKLRSSDQAEITEVEIYLILKPNINVQDRNELYKCVSVFEETDTTVKLKNRLENPLLNKLNSYPLSQILAETDSIEKALESLARTIMQEINFIVVDNSCRIKVVGNYPLRTELEKDKDNPNNIVWIEYLNSFEDRKTALLDKDKEWREKEDSFKLNIKRAEQKFEKAKRDIDIQIKNLDSYEAVEKKRIEVDNKKQIVALEIEKEQLETKKKEEIAKLSNQKAEAEIKELESEENIQLKQKEFEKKREIEDVKAQDEILLKKHQTEIDQLNRKTEMKKLNVSKKAEEIQEEKKYTEIINNYLSFEDILKKKQLEIQKEIAHIASAINDIDLEKEKKKSEQDHTLGSLPKKLEHEQKLEMINLKNSFELLKAIFDSQLLIFYNELQTNARGKYLEQLEKILPETLSSIKGMVSDLKIVSLPGSDSENPLNKLLQPVIQLISEFGAISPIFRGTLKELGIHIPGFSQNTANEKETNRQNDIHDDQEQPFEDKSEQKSKDKSDRDFD